MAIGAILSKGSLLKGSIVAAGGSGLGVAWWQAFDNLRPKEFKEEMGEKFILLNSDSSLDDIPYLSLGDSEKYNEVFRNGDCIEKYLPGEINDVVLKKESYIDNRGWATLTANGFSGAGTAWSKNRSRPGYGFAGTEGCLSISIKYNNGKIEKDRGIIGRMELVAWNDDIKEQDKSTKKWTIKVSGYGMVMSSIISNLDGQFKFINKLTFLKRNGEKWDVLDFAIWWNRGVDKTTLKNKEIEFNFGKEAFSFKLEKKNTGTKQLKNTQEYKKLARWIQGSKEQGNKDEFLGHWNINVDGKNSDIWQDLTGFIKNQNETVIFDSDLFYDANKKWYKNKQMKYDFGHFDTYNPTADGKANKYNGISKYGTWVNVLEECINKQSNYKNICD